MQNKSRDPYSRFDDVPSEAEKKAKVKKIAIIVAVVLVAIVAVVLGLVFGLKKKPLWISKWKAKTITIVL